MGTGRAYHQRCFSQKNSTELDNATLVADVGGWTSAMMGKNFSGTNLDGGQGKETIGNAYRDGQALRGARASVRANVDKQEPGWKSHSYLGLRSKTKEVDCSLRSDTEPRCWTDPGVAISVYQDASNVIIIFHSDWAINWHQYIIWTHRSWVIDEMGEQIKDQWQIDARQEFSVEMQNKAGDRLDELMERCAFKDVKHYAMADIAAMGARTDQAYEMLEAYGYWAVVKKVVRLILPESRDRITEKIRKHYFTGSGMGGAWAALASMWLKKVDDAAYDTFVIAGVGWQCFGRDLGFDLNTYDEHPQLKVYAHVMDIYAQMDRVTGTLCLYGFNNMTVESDVYHFCSGIVGFSGPQLMHRGLPFLEKAPGVMSQEYDNVNIQKNVKQARLDFESCHYYTHSLWYAAILFLNDRVLLHDGFTDGGCKELTPIPKRDITGQCPWAARVEADCAPLPDNSQPLPVMEMSVVAISLLSAIFIGGITVFALLQHFRSDAWVFGIGKKDLHKYHKKTFFEMVFRKACPCCKSRMSIELKHKRKVKHITDRAKVARARRKGKRLNSHGRGQASEARKKAALEAAAEGLGGVLKAKKVAKKLKARADLKSGTEKDAGLSEEEHPLNPDEAVDEHTPRESSHTPPDSLGEHSEEPASHIGASSSSTPPVSDATADISLEMPTSKARASIMSINQDRKIVSKKKIKRRDPNRIEEEGESETPEVPQRVRRDSHINTEGGHHHHQHHHHHTEEGAAGSHEGHHHPNPQSKRKLKKRDGGKTDEEGAASPDKGKKGDKDKEGDNSFFDALDNQV